jgi:hypothetical protein
VTRTPGYSDVKTSRAVLAALGLVFALAHVPFLARSLEDIDSVNFALGIRDFDLATHRPHPPGYPVYIALGKVTTAALWLVGDSSSRPSFREARALALLSSAAGLVAIGFLYVVFTALTPPFLDRTTAPWRTVDPLAVSATVLTMTCPLFSYLAVRPMSDLPGLALALASQACLLAAWWRQTPAADGDARLTAPVRAASGRLIVAGAFFAALALGLRTQTAGYTLPLLAVVLGDRIGRGVAGALLGSAMTFTLGALAWAIPLVVASGGMGAYLAALGSQAGEDFAGGEMLYVNPTPRAAAFAAWHTFVDPWDSPALATVVLGLAAAGVVRLALRERRTLVALIAMGGPYLGFHLLFQDTSFVRYALPLVPVVAFAAMHGPALVSTRTVPWIAAALSVWGVAVSAPVLVAYAAAPSPVVRAADALDAEARAAAPGAIAMHQTFVRPLEAEAIGVEPRLPSPPRLEWLDVVNYWKTGAAEPLWFLADPIRTDLALFDPRSLGDPISFDWSIVARPAFGGMRPSAVRWYRMAPPGWFCEDGWALTPETAGMARLRGKGPHLEPITARVRRRSGAARVLVGGRNLAPEGASAARFTLAVDEAALATWDAAPGFFLRTVDVPAGALAGEGALARLTIRSTPAGGGTELVPTSIEQFDLQDPSTLMWGYDEGWHEAEYSPALGLWRWTSERAVLRFVGSPADHRITLRMESPLRYFDAAPRVRVTAGTVELAATLLSEARQWTIDVPGIALAAADGRVTIETDRVFVPAERGGPPDRRRLGLRVFGVRVQNALTPQETTR